jgi:sugar phosphate permease
MVRGDDVLALPQERAVVMRAVLLVFLPFSGGYFLSYLFRSVNAVISGRLLADLGLNASDLGLLTSAYFLAFASFQLPLGLLLDRFGPRRVQASLLLAAALGSAVFSVGDDLGTLVAGRALIGLGVAGGLMASFKAITLWFPEARWPLVNGCFLGVGGLGAITATAPVDLAMQFVGWRGVFVTLAAATLLVSVTIFLIVPEKAREGAPIRMRQQLAGVKHIFTSRLFWVVAPLAIVTQALGMAVQGLWAAPWLRDVGGLAQDGVAARLFWLACGMTAGFVGGGVLADRLGRLGIRLGQVMGGGVLLFLGVQAVIVFQLVRPDAIWPWIAWGLTSNMSILAYPLLSRSFPVSYSGRANTAINLFVFIAAFTSQYAIGGLLDLWAEGGVGGYSGRSYRLAFGTFWGLEVLAFIWFALARRGRSPG